MSRYPKAIQREGPYRRNIQRLEEYPRAVLNMSLLVPGFSSAGRAAHGEPAMPALSNAETGIREYAVLI
ncbi:MAG TPA: hypothetical protein GX529_04770 [Firmicutes bacterium]|nr:hypothetical protein [Candidatus Fermentithermobacillaceae bacterium]